MSPLVGVSLPIPAPRFSAHLHLLQNFHDTQKIPRHNLQGQCCCARCTRLLPLLPISETHVYTHACTHVEGSPPILLGLSGLPCFRLPVVEWQFHLATHSRQQLLSWRHVSPLCTKHAAPIDPRPAAATPVCWPLSSLTICHSHTRFGRLDCPLHTILVGPQTWGRSVL
jgi:hypothetical protein